MGENSSSVLENRESFELIRGSSPLIVSLPHNGVEIPNDLKSVMSDAALSSIDSDWFMRELYVPITKRFDGSLISPRYSRYVIDLNRPKNDLSLYPGQTTTGLCPTERFDGQVLYRPGHEPDQAEKDRRLAKYWCPYHHALQAELTRLVTKHGYVLLWEGHSIKSIVPRLFSGQLPDLNIGTNDGMSCDPSIAFRLRESLLNQEQNSRGKGYTSVVNGRFKGGYITREYGMPSEGVHAVQLELSQSTYLANEEHPSWNRDDATEISLVIEDLIKVSLEALMDNLDSLGP